jgi:hypothetical protein
VIEFWDLGRLFGPMMPKPEAEVIVQTETLWVPPESHGFEPPTGGAVAD